MIAEKFVFGTGRLVSGASRGDSRKLVEAAYKLGFREFDTAPSYGLGGAEEVLGDVFAGDAGVRINTKVGSTRPGNSYAKSLVRKLKRALLGNKTEPREFTLIPQVEVPALQWMNSKDFMERSFEGSLKLLRRESVFTLLLHEAPMAIEGTPAEAFLTENVARGRASHAGVANSAFCDARRARPWILQASVDPEAFLEGGAQSGPDIVHSIVPAFRSLMMSNAIDAADVDQVLASAKISDTQSGIVALAYARLMRRGLSDRYIFSTSSVDRLTSFLSCVERLVEAGVA
jgi:hypothetical protein